MDKKRFSFSRMKAIIIKEFLHIRRDKASLAIAVAMPIVFLLLFGYAVNTDVEHLPTGVWDQSRSKESRELIRNFTNTLYFDHVYDADGYKDLQSQMDKGDIRVGLVIPPDYEKNIKGGLPTKIQIIIDGADPNAARTALANAQMIAQNKGIQMAGQQGTLPITAEIKVLYNPNMKSLIFNIPALIGLIMQNVTAILTAFALVRERERGTMEQLIVTPIRPAELILGKLIPYVFVGIFSFTLVLVLGILWFQVPVKGSITLLILLSLLFLVTTLAIGIVISTISRTQLQAMQMSFAIILPSVLLSGFIFPRETMPLLIQWIGGIIPLTYFLEILRGIFLKGIGMKELWQETLILSVFATVLCFIAMKRFRKKLE
jgi:ABC-2 type transport system permease protein